MTPTTGTPWRPPRDALRCAYRVRRVDAMGVLLSDIGIGNRAAAVTVAKSNRRGIAATRVRLEPGVGGFDYVVVFENVT